MPDLVVGYDPTQPVGQRLAPEVQTEIETVAPSVVDDGSITTAKLAPNSVTVGKIAPGAVTTPSIATGAVVSGSLGTGAVTPAKIAAGAVTSIAAGPGVATAQDATGNDISLRLVPITQSAYAALSSPDPNTLYLITG